MQEWFLSDLHENWFEAYTVTNKEDTTKKEYFYKWQGDIYDMAPGYWDEYIANEDGDEENGFHIANVIDWQKFRKIVTNFSESCDELQIKYDGGYTKSTSKFTPFGNGYACLWLFPIDSNNEYAGMAANPQNGCGSYTCFTHDNKFEYAVTNIQNTYVRVRLVRDIPAGKW